MVCKEEEWRLKHEEAEGTRVDFDFFDLKNALSMLTQQQLIPTSHAFDTNTINGSTPLAQVSS